jgi:hypothetical protein
MEAYEEWCARAWFGLNRLEIGSSSEALGMRNEHLGFIKADLFLTGLNKTLHGLCKCLYKLQWFWARGLPVFTRH